MSPIEIHWRALTTAIFVGILLIWCGVSPRPHQPSSQYRIDNWCWCIRCAITFIGCALATITIIWTIKL